MKEQFVKWLNRILIFDVFLVIAGFLWFAVAVIGESTGIPLGFKLFQRLWLPLFNPAISILWNKRKKSVFFFSHVRKKCNPIRMALSLS